jgi:hypothetical protein
MRTGRALHHLTVCSQCIRTHSPLPRSARCLTVCSDCIRMADPCGFRDPSNPPADFGRFRTSRVKVFGSLRSHDVLFVGLGLFMVSGSYWRVICPYDLDRLTDPTHPPPRRESAQNVARIPNSTWVGLWSPEKRPGSPRQHGQEAAGLDKR